MQVFQACAPEFSSGKNSIKKFKVMSLNFSPFSARGTLADALCPFWFSPPCVALPGCAVAQRAFGYRRQQLLLLAISDALL